MSERYTGIETRKSTEQHKPRHELHKTREVAERNPENEQRETEQARHEALDKALGSEQYNKPQVEDESGHSGPPTASRVSLKESFGKTMARVGSELPPASRAFSKFIHLPGVEKTSDIVASTVARPHAILSGSVCALIATGALYFTARYFGFSLSGSESIAAFAAGWLIGLLFDITRSTFKRRV